MPTAALRKATRQQRYHHGNLRATLIDEGARIIEKRGIPALTLRAVAEAAGVSRQAPYHHFGDKDGLLAAIAVAGFEQLTCAMRKEAAHYDVGEDCLVALGGGICEAGAPGATAVRPLQWDLYPGFLGLSRTARSARGCAGRPRRRHRGIHGNQRDVELGRRSRKRRRLGHRPRSCAAPPGTGSAAGQGWITRRECVRPASASHLYARDLGFSVCAHCRLIGKTKPMVRVFTRQAKRRWTVTEGGWRIEG